MTRKAIAGAKTNGSPVPEAPMALYESDSFSSDTIAKFIGTGIGAGEPVVVIATAAHQAAFVERLEQNSVDVARARERGQLILVDAEETLARILVGGRPARDRFESLMDELLARARHGREDQTVRIYGELLALLWCAGERQAASELEALCNRFGARQPFHLLCAYVIDNLYKELELGRSAAAPAPTREPVLPLGDTHQSARLAAQAVALRHEVERRRRLEGELMRSQKRLSDLLDHAALPMHWVDPSGIIVWANHAELALVGYAREEYVGHQVAEFHDDRAAISEILEHFARHETVREAPARLRCKDGSLRYVLIDSNVLVEDGKLVHMRCFTRDVSARIATDDDNCRQLCLSNATRATAEEKFRDSELKMRLLIDSIRDYAIFMLDPDGYVVSWNEGAQRTKGYAPSDIIGKHFSVFYPEVDKKAGKCEYELRVAAKTGRFEDEGWRVRKDGTRFWANVIISAVRDEDGELVGFAKVTRDLTDRKRAEEERAALAAAEEANRAKDEFLAMLGHELRNPLAPIVTALQLMKLRGDVSSSKEQVIIERQVQHVVRLVDDLLDVSRITQGKVTLKKETFELAEVVAKAVEIASPLLEQRRHQLFVDVPRKGMRLCADPVRMAQVIANLLTNAAKYTDVEGNVELSAWRDGHEVVLQVKDSGVGIAPELLPRVFSLFVQGPRTADRAEGGLGIGLTLVRTLVQQHGGTVVALSDGVGKGSAFVIRMPAATALAEQEIAASQVTAFNRPRHKRRILVVDDNVDAAALMAELLSTIGHEVRVAHDGPEALAALEPFQPEVAVLDIGLPVMDGYELAKRIGERLGTDCRLIALTGYGQEHDRRRSHDSGFEAHLVKPIDPARILSLIDDADDGTAS